jgi:hypothetical protein
MTPAVTDALNASAPELRGQASGVLQAARQVGGSVGLAIMGTIVVTVQHDHFSSFLRGLPPQAAPQTERMERLLSEVESGDRSALRQLPEQAIETARYALTAGVSSAYYVAAGVLLAGAVAAGLLLRRAQAADAEAPAPAVTAGKVVAG